VFAAAAIALLIALALLLVRAVLGPTVFDRLLAANTIGTVAVVLLALAITGWVAARLGGAKSLRPILRVIVGGALAMSITFGIGHLVGATIG